MDADTLKYFVQMAIQFPITGLFIWVVLHMLRIQREERDSAARADSEKQDREAKARAEKERIDREERRLERAEWLGALREIKDSFEELAREIRGRDTRRQQ
jgi:hypothetical protein